MSLYELAGIGLGILSTTGIAWYAKDMIEYDPEVEEEELIQEIAPEAAQNVSVSNLGTGSKAGQRLGASIFEAKRIFVSGAITKAVYTTLRDYMSPQCTLEILYNPSFGGAVPLHSITRRFETKVKQTNKLQTDAITTFYLPGMGIAYLLVKENNAVSVSDNKESADYIASGMLKIWRES